MPSLAGATEWLNSPPLGPDLRGHTLLIHFWTFTCINWLRQQPHVRAWSQAYRGDGLIVIGVHTPEFSLERDVGGVQRAMEERAIDYPVAVDNEYEVWEAFANRYWPALYFVDAGGVIRDRHFGEGRYEGSERVIQRLLGRTGKPVQVVGTGVEAEADWDNLRASETYLGHRRGERFASPGGPAFGERREYRVPARLDLGTWALSGEWIIGPERVTQISATGGIAFRFHARDAHVVMSGTSEEPVPFRVRVDGAPPQASHGEDVDEQGDGLLLEGRLYHLVRERDAVRQRTVEITFLDAGAELYVLTFG